MGNEIAIPTDCSIKWEKCSTDGQVPGGREGYSTTIIDSKLILFGGGLPTTNPDDPPIQSNELFKLDIETSVWVKEEVGGTLPCARSGAAMGAVDGKIFLFGGLSMERGWLNDIHVYDTTASSWSSPDTKGTPPSERDKSSCCAKGTKIYIFGGFGPQEEEEEEEEENIVSEGTIEGTSSSTVTDASAQNDERGEGEEGEEEQSYHELPSANFVWYNDLFVFDTITMTWEKLTVEGAVPSPRAASAMCINESSDELEFYVFGGKDSKSRLNDIFRLRVLHGEEGSRGVWEAIDTFGLKPIPRSFHSLTSIGANRLVVFGGLSQTNAHLNDLHLYDTIQKAWVQPKTKTESLDIKARASHTALLNDSTFFIYGGTCDFDPMIGTSTTYLNDLYSINTGELQSVVITLPPTNPE